MLWILVCCLLDTMPYIIFVNNFEYFPIFTRPLWKSALVDGVSVDK